MAKQKPPRGTWFLGYFWPRDVHARDAVPAFKDFMYGVQAGVFELPQTDDDWFTLMAIVGIYTRMR